MFSHVMVGADDIDAARKFYDATFAAFGGPQAINGEPACGANGGTIGFRMTPEQADAWHAAGVAAGGTACEDPPGPREGSPYYLAYLRDPAGNKLCALDIIA
ncbi:MAG: VOC family protein [Novosphingobium sp.]